MADPSKSMDNGFAVSDRDAKDYDIVTQGRTASGRPTRKSIGGWTEEEDELLRSLVQQFNGKKWKKVARFFPNRTDLQCLHRWQKVINPDVVKGSWTKQEDDLLTDLVTSHGAQKWSVIATNLPGRIGKQCRERWYNHLDPDINREPWTEEEDTILARVQQSLGNKWTEITKHLPGRTDNAIKNRWNSRIRKLNHSAQGPEMKDPSQSIIATDVSQPSEHRSVQEFNISSARTVDYKLPTDISNHVTTGSPGEVNLSDKQGHVGKQDGNKDVSLAIIPFIPHDHSQASHADTGSVDHKRTETTVTGFLKRLKIAAETFEKPSISRPHKLNSNMNAGNDIKTSNIVEPPYTNPDVGRKTLLLEDFRLSDKGKVGDMEERISEEIATLGNNRTNEHQLFDLGEAPNGSDPQSLTASDFSSLDMECLALKRKDLKKPSIITRKRPRPSGSFQRQNSENVDTARLELLKTYFNSKKSIAAYKPSHEVPVEKATSAREDTRLNLSREYMSEKETVGKREAKGKKKSSNFKKLRFK